MRHIGIRGFFSKFAAASPKNSNEMITNSGLNEMKDIMAYLDKVPYCVTRRSLYTADELYEGFKANEEKSYGNCFDGRVYQYYQFTGKQDPGVEESLARSLHDHCIHTALARFLHEHYLHGEVLS